MGPASHVFVDDLTALELSDEDRRHLERVLRLRPGEEVTASDGHGGWRRLRYRGSGLVEPDGDIEHHPALTPAVTVGFALTKGERPEWAVQKLTEAGVDHIVPFVAARTVVRWDGEKGARQVMRLRAVARSAAMQSRRVRLPVVHDLADFAVAVALAADLGASGAGPDSGPAAGLGSGSTAGPGSGSTAGPGSWSGAALAHPGGPPPNLIRPAVLVGPEGGFSDDELGVGLPTVGLGPSILRAETAAMAAGVLLCALRGNLVLPAG
jgi:16S rRNA (uracil1498-N3)-methyltransferase